MSVESRFPWVKARIAGPILTLGVMALAGELPAIAADAPAQAQAAAPNDAGTAQAATATGSSATTLQEVVVTGTSISGGNAQLALPVQTLSASDIARTGATSVPELLQNVPAVSSVGTTTLAQGTGFITGGLSTVSLHGLGATRTLVLVNGLRSAVYGGTSVGDVVESAPFPLRRSSGSRSSRTALPRSTAATPSRAWSISS